MNRKCQFESTDTHDVRLLGHTNRSIDDKNKSRQERIEESINECNGALQDGILAKYCSG